MSPPNGECFAAYPRSSFSHTLKLDSIKALRKCRTADLIRNSTQNRHARPLWFKACLGNREFHQT
jgi:hypothetical protein